MLKNKIKQGSILLYVMLLVNIALVVGVVVYNNSYVIVNNIDVGNNQEEVFSNIYNKGNIALESARKYNSNGKGFLDGISCPQNVTMSGTVVKTTGLSTTLVYKYGKVHCLGTYDTGTGGIKEFKINYDDEVNDFNTAQFDGDIVNVIESSGTNITVSNTNLGPSSNIIASNRYSSSYDSSFAVDNNTSTSYISEHSGGRRFIQFELSGSAKSLGRIVIKKQAYTAGGNTWNNGSINFFDSGGSYIDNIQLSGMRTKTIEDIDLIYSLLSSDVKYIQLNSDSGYLTISEFEIYELESTGGEEIWQGERNFTDSDATLISFSKDGIEGNDGIDDDLNSDNYKVTSIGNIYFPDGYQDDDVVPRKTIFGSIPPQREYEHVYWNNYKTLKVIDENTNNDDLLNVKMGDVNNAHMFINTFNTEELDYSLKILEFDRDVYENNFTLLPLGSYEGKNISKYLGYINKTSSGVLYIDKDVNSSNIFDFDFQTKDYAIFLENNSQATLSYHLEAYTPSGSGVYINPIDDSGTGTIKVLSNHIIIGGEKNFIGENFEVVGSK